MLDNRLELLKIYLSSIFDKFTIVIASNDASFRRYFRVLSNDKSYIVMDAPPEKGWIDGFVKIAKFFKNHNINTPKIYFENLADGFLILEDFGDITLLKNNNLTLYKLAIDELLKIQNLRVDFLPNYNQEILQTEMNLCPQWFNQDFDYTDIFEIIMQNILTHKQVVVHRDYHSRNIMVTKNKLGIIDFQDAIIGSYTYDIAALLRDGYIDLGDISALQQYYFDKSGLDNYQQFILDFDMIATQRHLKILGIFKRLSIRDDKDNYLDDLPMIKKYVSDIGQKYPKLQGLQKLCKQ